MVRTNHYTKYYALRCARLCRNPTLAGIYPMPRHAASRPRYAIAGSR
jgi:hypothetical protein